MPDFIKITDHFLVSRQIEKADVDRAADQGVKVIICNRPDGERPNQPPADEIAGYCKAKGIAFAHVPLVSGQLTPEVVAGMNMHLPADDRLTLAYCMSGTRSVTLWSLVQAGRQSLTPKQIKQAAEGGGYDMEPLSPMLEMMIERGV